MKAVSKLIEVIILGMFRNYKRGDFGLLIRFSKPAENEKNSDLFGTESFHLLYLVDLWFVTSRAP